jgi:hypothetical protein
VDFDQRPVFYITRKHDVSGIWTQWLRLALSKVPNRVCASFPSPHLRRKQIQFPSYLKIRNTILHIIHRSAFYLEHDVSETGFCLRLQVEPTQFGPIDWASLYPDQNEKVPPENGDRMQSPKCCVLNKTGRWIMPRTVIVILRHHRPSQTYR